MIIKSASLERAKDCNWCLKLLQKFKVPVMLFKKHTPLIAKYKKEKQKSEKLSPTYSGKLLELQKRNFWNSVDPIEYVTW